MNAVSKDIWDFFKADARLSREREKHRNWLRGRIRALFEQEIERMCRQTGAVREITEEQMNEMVERRVRDEMGEVD